MDYLFMAIVVVSCNKAKSIYHCIICSCIIMYVTKTCTFTVTYTRTLTSGDALLGARVLVLVVGTRRAAVTAALLVDLTNGTRHGCNKQ